MSDTRPRTHAVPRHAIEGMRESDDQLIGMVTALAAQLAVTRERLDTVERLAEAAGLFGPDAVDRYVPDERAQGARDTIRQTLIDRIFRPIRDRSEEHTSELQSLMRISYAVFCLKK